MFGVGEYVKAGASLIPANADPLLQAHLLSRPKLFQLSGCPCVLVPFHKLGRVVSLRSTSVFCLQSDIHPGRLQLYVTCL
uniref:Uncharacterized protein n=1 Tax=Anguilla anguilla TaxID=7936 RepID=A0A0E9WUX3_ANGAN